MYLDSAKVSGSESDDFESLNIEFDDDEPYYYMSMLDMSRRKNTSISTFQFYKKVWNQHKMRYLSGAYSVQAFVCHGAYMLNLT